MSIPPVVLWQVCEDGAREVHATPKNQKHTEWIVSPVTGGEPETVSAADLAPTEEVALLLWHERNGHVEEVDRIVGEIGVRYRGTRARGWV